MAGDGSIVHVSPRLLEEIAENRDDERAVAETLADTIRMWQIEQLKGPGNKDVSFQARAAVTRWLSQEQRRLQSLVEVVVHHPRPPGPQDACPQPFVDLPLWRLAGLAPGAA